MADKNDTRFNMQFLRVFEASKTLNPKPERVLAWGMTWCKVFRDAAYKGTSYSCSVRIQRPSGEAFSRPAVIKQVEDGTIIWGRQLTCCYHLDMETSQKSFIGCLQGWYRCLVGSLKVDWGS